MQNEDIKKLQTTVNLIAQTTANILSTMATKEELSKTNKNVANLQVTVNAIQTDIRSFKEDTQHNFDRLEKRMDDSDHTLMSFDKRIEFLETKALV